MKKSFLFAAILLSGMLFFVGCGGGSDDSSTTVADPAAAPAADPADAVNAAFAAVTPSGIAQTDKFTIAGRGTVLTVECGAISGAVSYTFTTSFGASVVSASRSTAIQATTAQGSASYTLSVYATNADGVNTKTGSASVN